MNTRSAKAKGRRLQQWVRDTLINISGLEKDDVQSAIMGERGEDIKLSPAARHLYPYSFECKNCEKASPWAWYEQAEYNSGPYEPVVVFKKNGKKPLAIIDAEELLNLMTQNGVKVVDNG